MPFPSLGTAQQFGVVLAVGVETADVRNGKQRAASTVENCTSPTVPRCHAARVLAMSLEQPKVAVAASMGKAKVAGKIVQRHEHGQPGAFAELNDDELQQAILEQTRELAEIDPDFAKQLAQQKRATKH